LYIIRVERLCALLINGSYQASQGHGTVSGHSYSVIPFYMSP